ncbi:MAG: four helix bundle protein [Flavisolibacter sp.]
MGHYKNLLAYQKAYRLAMEIFIISKRFPGEERYCLTNQIRRSSRSVCANLAEAYRRRKYMSHFISKLTDCSTENSETEVWIDFVRDCGYINEEEHIKWSSLNNEVGNLLFHMINNPDKYL